MDTRSHSNFSFLSYFRQLDLLELAQKAEQYYPGDPDSVLLQLRKYTEAAVRFIAEKHRIDLDEQSQKNLFQALAQLEEKAVGQRFLTLAHDLRKRCNHGAHYQHSKEASAEEVAPVRLAAEALQTAYQLGVWLYQNHGPKHQRFIRRFVLPADGQPVAAKQLADNQGTLPPKPELKPELKPEPESELKPEPEPEPELQQYKKVTSTDNLADKSGHIPVCTDSGAVIYYARAEHCYIKGQYQYAAEWYVQAATRGHAEAGFKLGMMYWHGRGLTADKIQAAHWLQHAAACGHQGAQAALARLTANNKD